MSVAGRTVNGISPLNPNPDRYMQAAIDAFGGTP